jgi:hypothetical protein
MENALDSPSKRMFQPATVRLFVAAGSIPTLLIAIGDCLSTAIFNPSRYPQGRMY